MNFHYRVDHGTGGVTEIRTVMDADGGSTNSCLPSTTVNYDVLFTLNTFTPAQCSVLSILTKPPNAIRGYVPSGTPFTIDSDSNGTGNITTHWTVSVPTGTSFVLLYEGVDGSLATSGLMKTSPDSGNGNSCLIDAPVTTLGMTGASLFHIWLF